MEWACEAGEAKGLSSDARTVLVAVAYFAGSRDGMAWQATRAEIMAKTALGAHRVIRAIREIEEAKVVGMKRRRYGISWGPFPVAKRAELSTPPRASARTGARHITASLPTRRAADRAAGARTGARNTQERENLSSDDCARCGGAGVLLGAEKPNGDRSVVRCGCRA